ncbi:MAG: mechanosensitive ion channel domain-containing protein [Desulforhopalus sp.]
MSWRLIAAPLATFTLWLLLAAVFAHGNQTVVSSRPHVLPLPATSATDAADDAPTRGAFLSKWLHMLDTSKHSGTKESSVLAFGHQVPGDMAKVLSAAGGNRGLIGVLAILAETILSIAVGLVMVFLLQKALKKPLGALTNLSPPSSETPAKIAAAVIRSLPELVSMIILALSSVLFFLLISGGVTAGGRMLFQLVLGLVLIFKACHLVSRIIFSPRDGRIRLFALDDALVARLHLAFSNSVAILGSMMLFIRCFRELGVQPQTISWLAILLGSTILAILAYLTFYLRESVTNFFINEPDYGNSSWLRQQVVQHWHLLGLLYLAAVWVIGVGQEAAGAAVRNGAFIVSVLIVPIYFGLSHAGRVLINAVIESLDLDREEEDLPEKERKTDQTQSSRQIITSKAHAVFRLLLVATLIMWVISLWGYNIPFAAHAMRAIFESLVALALALLCWRYSSRYIENKISEATPENDSAEEDADDEFGSAVQRGRSHTLLPLLRKAIGSVLIVMVTLITISALGVNIGPLLAGAGVFGLAIGFGAQKLVSDVLSGFFFLLDDAFRVGEYIQAGSIRGTVESITLRNVLLRHHLGMLQVVPHSDLGAITNYMRGGIVIKFPLEFPYDTDIDQVRKIIKKVGLAMLEDEELGDDFLQPLKSQGVYEITNSVMVIRVKFTAKPGKQFMIKREAFRRITEALAAKGIYYAHRKVIVDFPADSQPGTADEATRKKALEAGAAAAISEPPAEAGERQQKDW